MKEEHKIQRKKHTQNKEEKKKKWNQKQQACTQTVTESWRTASADTINERRRAKEKKNVNWKYVQLLSLFWFEKTFEFSSTFSHGTALKRKYFCFWLQRSNYFNVSLAKMRITEWIEICHHFLFVQFFGFPGEYLVLSYHFENPGFFLILFLLHSG